MGLTTHEERLTQEEFDQFLEQYINTLAKSSGGYVAVTNDIKQLLSYTYSMIEPLHRDKLYGSMQAMESLYKKKNFL